MADSADINGDPTFPREDAVETAFAWQAARFPHALMSRGVASSGFEPADSSWQSDSPFVDALMDYQDLFAPGMDDRTRGAHLVAFYSHHLGIAAGALFLQTGGVPELDPGTLAVRFEPLSGVNLSNHPSDARRLHFRVNDVARVADPLPQFHDAFVSNLRPVVDAVVARTGLSPTAQWRLAADGLAGAFLDVGVALRDDARAMRLALAILCIPRSPLASKVRYERVETIVDGVANGRFFRLRGGCCLSYRVPGGRFCDVCVLLDDETRKSRLRARLEHAGGR